MAQSRGSLISIHAPRTGSDAGTAANGCVSLNFNPRSPHGERRDANLPHVLAALNFNPRSPHGERHGGSRLREGKENISIHAPRTGSDPRSARKPPESARFQSTLPARGATMCISSTRSAAFVFQSTLPARGATVPASSAVSTTNYFNPRSPHGERPRTTSTSAASTNFNPRSPHGERLCGCPLELIRRYFNPRSPHGERPRPLRGRTALLHISIHAPRTGSDINFRALSLLMQNFNPRSPHGERRVHHARASCQRHFNPRSPHGERPAP